MRVLLIGSGSIGRRHLESLRILGVEVELALLRSGAREDGWSREQGATVFGDFPAALAWRPKLAIIANPSMLHFEALRALLPAGVPCYVEKPVIADSRQVEALWALLRSVPNPPPTQAGCNLRFLPSLIRLAELLEGGAVGRVVRASLQVGQWLPDWRPAQDYRASYSADPARGGGVVLDLVHELDAARWLFGEFSTVRAVGGHFSRLEIASEDSAAILLGRPGGPAVAIGLDYVSRRPMRRYEIVGDEASLCWDLPAHRLDLIGQIGVEAIDCGPAAFDVAATYRAAMTELLTAVQGGPPCRQDLAEGLRSATLALRVKDAMREPATS